MSAKHQGCIPALIRRLSLSFHPMEVAVIALVMFAAGTAGALDGGALLPTPNNIELQDTATSPGGTWVVERYKEIYSQDTDIRLALHYPQHSPATRSQYLPYLGEDLVFKWLDDSTLLIAEAEGTDQGTKPEHQLDEQNKPKEFNGVKLHYGYYTYEPDTPRSPGSQKIFTKRVTFSYRFKAVHDIGEPSNECDLYMIAPDGDYVQNLSLRLSAAKLYPNGEWQHAPKNSFAVNIDADKEARKTLGPATGAKVENFSPTDGKPMMGREFKEIMALDGSPAAGWDIVYQLQSQKTLQAIINKIKSGNLHVKVGFWLDNAEVIYSSNAPKDVSSVEAFESCIKKNHIFIGQKPDDGGI